MTRRSKILSLCVASMAGAVIASGARGEDLPQVAWRTGMERAEVGETAGAPPGWVDFCVRYKPECDAGPQEARDAELTPKTWAALTVVNAWVNKSIKPVEDVDHWGVVDRWDYPDDGKGDCEDYVLLKRRMLMLAGFPRSALLITVVRDEAGEGHAVLTVKTGNGDLVLDNEESKILPWSQTGYAFYKRQSQTDQNVWVYLDGSSLGQVGAVARKSLAKASGQVDDR